MIKRTLYFGNPAYLSKQQKQLKVTEPKTNNELGSIPIEDIGVMLLDNYQITITHGLIVALTHNNTAIISCDERHLPQGLMLPMDGHTLQTERLRFQIEMSEPLRKNLWQQTVKAKVENQASLLQIVEKENKRLKALVPQIQSGDPDNIEGRAASVYWKVLFEETNFTRQRYGVAPNAHLNYCYAVLRAIVARALVGSGLSPTIGIFHRNKYNSYCLADDIMEPFRPYCDELVYNMWQEGEIDSEEITIEQKRKLLSIATVDVQYDKQKSPLMVGLSRTTNSLYECLAGERRKIVYPQFLIN
ncbi:type II CRISPR-associated endonuclease Cas1 [Carboxylicivirga caseinilyticus]|uniref:type II CRISPR-associated endonuclease Cas1 n=1 Tax=Carboxylicivirga caseinilyticus TaxID=3417572 RepID=UPI003D325097|nr:type II CRISPR-associated endonuclease Cas1 [Marinilabiliaceae bacterium A049]